MRQVWRRIAYLLNRRRLQAELEADMTFHREMAARAGCDNFGNALRMRELSSEAWGWTWLDYLLQDLQYGTRILLRAPRFTVLIVLVLAIGIGVNVAAFSLFDMVALRPLPVRDAASLVRLERRSPNAYTSEMAYASFCFYRDHARTLSAAIAVLGVPPMQVDDDVTPTHTTFTTPNYFTELGAQAAYGRLFDPSLDNSISSPSVVILSYSFWRNRFGSDPSIIGRTIHVNRKPVTIIGITPFDFASLGGQHPDLWMPMAQQPYMIESSQVLTDWTNSSVRMWGRLTPGVSVKASEQELRTLTDTLRNQHPEAVWDSEFLQISPGGHLQVFQPDMYQIAAMVGVLTLLILAVACANVGSLLLARGIVREHEIGIRLAIGAGRGRIVRQLCTESILLAGLGTVAGVVVSYFVLRVTLTSIDAPKWLTAVPDWRVALFAVVVMVTSTLLFGFAPALQLARQRHRRTTIRQVLLAAQVAASCLLLIVSGLLVRATQHLLFNDPGFAYEGTVSIDSHLDQHGYSETQAKLYLDQMEAGLRAAPGVRSISLVRLPPMGHTVSREKREINGRQLMLYPNWVSPDYFQTMQIPLLMGRTLYPNEKNAVIVSRSFAQAAWPDKNPLGQLLPEQDAKDRVVGVVGDAHINALNDDDAAEAYWAAQSDNMPALVVVARFAGSPAGVQNAARIISENLDRHIFPEIRQLKQLYHDIALQIEQVAGIVSLIGIVAVFMAAIGILGVVSFSLSQRTKEVAIRLALGSSKPQLCIALLRQFVWPVASGFVAGTILTMFGSRFLRVALYGVSNLDPLGFAGGIGLLLVVVILSAVLPTRRAMRLNVMRALHND